MSGPQRPGSTYATTRARTIPLAVFVAVLALTVILTAALVVVGTGWLASRRTADVTPNPLPAVSAAVAAKALPRNDDVASTRLSVVAPRRVLDTGRRLPPGAQIKVALPGVGSGTSAVLLQLSTVDAVGPGLVTLTSSVDNVPALRLPAKGAQTSATVVAVLGPDHALTVRTAAGGRLIADLIGTFDQAGRSTAGRIIPVPATLVLRLRPVLDGHDAVIDLDRIRRLPGAASVSAVMLRVGGEVGAHGGLISIDPAPAARQPSQTIYWGATSGADLIRNGLMVVPVTSRRLHVHYKAGTEVRVELVGYVTGKGGTPTSTGLSVPLPAKQAPAVRVAAAGRSQVQLVPATGIAGLRPAQVSAVLTGLTVSGEAPGAVSVVAVGASRSQTPDLSAAVRTRSALALTRLTNGVVSIVSQSNASVILTPRLLILR